MGQNVRHPELVQDQDADNALALVEFSNGKILHFHCSRTTMHGHDCVAEVFGTEGRAVVNGVSSSRSLFAFHHDGMRGGLGLTCKEPFSQPDRSEGCTRCSDFINVRAYRPRLITETYR